MATGAMTRTAIAAAARARYVQTWMPGRRTTGASVIGGGNSSFPGCAMMETGEPYDDGCLGLSSGGDDSGIGKRSSISRSPAQGE